jgi:hypothetical protein
VFISIVEIANANLGMQSIVIERLMLIAANPLNNLSEIPNTMKPKTHANRTAFMHTRAYKETHNILKPLGIQCVSIVDLRYLAGAVSKQAGLPDGPPIKRQADIYRKFDQHWETVGPHVLRTVDQWARRRVK